MSSLFHIPVVSLSVSYHLLLFARMLRFLCCLLLLLFLLRFY